MMRHPERPPLPITPWPNDEPSTPHVPERGIVSPEFSKHSRQFVMPWGYGWKRVWLVSFEGMRFFNIPGWTGMRHGFLLWSRRLPDVGGKVQSKELTPQTQPLIMPELVSI